MSSLCIGINLNTTLIMLIQIGSITFIKISNFDTHNEISISLNFSNFGPKVPHRDLIVMF